MLRIHSFVFGLGVLVAAGVVLLVTSAESAQGTKVGPSAKDVQTVRDKAIAFLRSSQNKDGSFSPKFAGPGITSLAIAGLIRNGVAADDPVVANALKWLEAQAKADGGIHNQKLANYTTSVAVMALRDANIKGKYDAALKRAADFLKKIQHDADDLDHGGFGYDKNSRPDMSNSAFTVEALLAAGLSKDDPAVKNALKFISRCQNLPGEANEQPWAIKTSADDKGGFV
ncbi:MAG: terpene cyclase/mutase family protein, partial [Planctomycetes bacterium]|nr:terpene cyclase/mutase family protein [Planctomycetota bacterium]